jgi:hypothetical protein
MTKFTILVAAVSMGCGTVVDDNRASPGTDSDTDVKEPNKPADGIGSDTEASPSVPESQTVSESSAGRKRATNEGEAIVVLDTGTREYRSGWESTINIRQGLHKGPDDIEVFVAAIGEVGDFAISLSVQSTPSKGLGLVGEHSLLKNHNQLRLSDDVSASSGTIVIEKVEGGQLKGRFSAKLATDEVVEGSFSGKVNVACNVLVSELPVGALSEAGTTTDDASGPSWVGVTAGHPFCDRYF